MLKKIAAKLSMVAFIMFFSMTSFVPEAQAYSYNGNLVLNQIRFIPHVNFDQTSIAHFNDAIYQWNSNAG